MIRCTLDDCGNLINGRKLDRRFLPGIDTRRWETILQKSPLVASSKFFFSFYGLHYIGMARTRLPNEAAIGCNIMTCCIQMAGSVNRWTWKKTNIRKYQKICFE
jgi:hypothetical protein